jgi:ubiquinone biosynthesis monooxygenase Coq7
MGLIDNFIGHIDGALRTLTGVQEGVRENPAAAVPEAPLDDAQVKHAAGLMRVNHTGEVCAQALYEGQALTATDAGIKASLLAAAAEESDHLAWCEERLSELHSGPSVLNPVFYAASYAIGAVTGLLGDKISLGFVAATEDQVCKHLESHMEVLPDGDDKSRSIVKQMHADEARHGAAAMAAGGVEYPPVVKTFMSAVSRVMTQTTYKI